MNLREKILSRKSKTTPTFEPVNVPAWGEGLKVRAMSAAERDEFDLSLNEDGEKKMSNFRARLVVLTLCDADGKRVFDDTDAEELGETDTGPVCAVAEVAMKLNGLSKSDVAELEKN